MTIGSQLTHSLPIRACGNWTLQTQRALIIRPRPNCTDPYSTAWQGWSFGKTGSKSDHKSLERNKKISRATKNRAVIHFLLSFRQINQLVMQQFEKILCDSCEQTIWGIHQSHPWISPTHVYLTNWNHTHVQCWLNFNLIFDCIGTWKKNHNTTSSNIVILIQLCFPDWHFSATANTL